MTVSTTTTAVSAAGDGSTTDFTFTFEILAASDLRVIVVTDSTGAESEKTLTTDYTVAGVGQVNGGTVTFVTAPASGETVHIKRGNMALTQPTNYTPNDPFPAETHENALDRVALQIQQINEKLGRAIVRSETDSASAQLPINETIKGKTLAFNETTGAVEAGPSVADVGTVSGIAADIATLADIEDGTDATDAIQTVASISSNVSTVAGISSDVTNVSNNAANVSTVASDSSNIATVSGNISDVNTVSSNITSVNTVATNIADVITVANDLNEAISEVETVANDLNEAVSEIDTVAGSISNVDTVGTNIANINTVAGISGNVTTVAGISSNVTTVAGVSADVTTVAGISANVTTVAGISSNVSTVAGISSDVTTVAGVSANVTTVATDITNVNTVATNIADVNNFALTYRIAASAPATSLDEGDLYFDTTQNKMFVYDGSAWVTVSPDLVADTSPQLGGNLDLNGNNITGTGNISTTGTATFTGDLTVDTNTLYVDSTNNRVGIKTSSPSAALHILDTSTPQAKIAYDSNRYMNVEHATIYNVSGAAQSNNLKFATRGNSGNNNITFFTGGTDASGTSESERLRLSSDGNLQLGKTASGIATNGITLYGDGAKGAADFTRDGGRTLALNRKTSDGDIMEFRKDGSAVGSIGSRGAGTSYIILKSSAGAGAGLTGSDNAILPMDESALADANTSLGTGSYRFNNLYLSGQTFTTGHYLTGSAYLWNTENQIIRFGTNNTERMRLDNSGNLLVGKTANSIGGSGVVIRGGGELFSTRAGDVAGFNRLTTDGPIVQFYKDSSVVGVIGTQNWGIGTSSPVRTLDIATTTGGTIIHLTDDSTGHLATDGVDIQQEGTLFQILNREAGDIRLGTNGAERLRIDSSGNLLVGGTSLGENGAVTMAGDGRIYAIRASDTAGFFGRTTTNGSIVKFTKDGSEVGSIGNDSTELYIGMSVTNNSGFAAGVSGGTPVIFPTGSNGAVRDNAISLGYSTGRWKDLYLSGNANVGDLIGPASANFDIKTGSGTGDMIFHVNGSERSRIDASGILLIGKTSTSSTGTGHILHPNSASFAGRDNGIVYAYNRNGTDGGVIQIMNNDVVEGTISVSGTTVTYGGGHLARWSRLPDDSKDASIVKGTVMTNLDAMVEWGDEDNEQLNKTAVSSVEGDVNVAGVFVSWDDDDEWNDFYVAMTGDMIIRIASGTTVARGDLLMSAGDGTAKPQGDDIVRSKTIAKVTSTNVSHTYDDGSYCVPCVLMAC